MPEVKLTRAEMKTAAYLLHLAADQFSHHGCNDLRLVTDVGLTEAEAREIHDLLESENEEHEREPFNGYGSDWHAMRLLACRLATIAETTPL